MDEATEPQELPINQYYFTFGVQYHPGGAQHPVFIDDNLSKGYVTIEAPDYETARLLAVAAFGNIFAFQYDRVPQLRYAPRGEVGRLRWQLPAMHTTGRDAIARDRGED